MAIDTALKRGSALNVSSPWRSILPLPDGAVTQPDRQVVPFMYSGIAASGVEENGADQGWLHIPSRRRAIMRSWGR